MTDGGNGWDQHKIDVNRRLDGHDEGFRDLEKKVDELTRVVDRLPGRMAIAVLTVFLSAASSGLTTWLLNSREQAAMTQEDREMQRAIRDYLERLSRERGDDKETSR